MGVYIEGLQSERKRIPYFIPFENSSYNSEKEDSQRGDLFDQDNSNFSCSNEDLNKSPKSPLSNDFLNEKRREEENSYYSLYHNCQRITNILKKITIILIINNKEKKVIFEKVIYNEIDIPYETFKDFSIEELKKQFKFNGNSILFESKEKLIEYLNNIKEIAENSFPEIKLENELFISINLNEEKNKNINSEYIFIDKLVFKDKQHQDKDILNNDNYEGFISFLNKIKKYISIQANINNSTKDATKNSKQIKNTNFISFKKIIGKHKEFAQKIRELDNGSFISGGHDGIIQYDKNYYKIYNNNAFSNDYITFFTDKDEVIISLQNQFTSLSKLGKSISGNEGIYPCRNLFKSEDFKIYIICNDNGIFCAYHIFNEVIKKNPSKLYDKAYRGGIKITDNIIAITSNRFLKNGENKLIFFNSKSQKFLKDFEIENYSFTLSENNCSLMEIPNNKNIKLLLVACKKYLEGDQNGILLIKLQFNEDNIKENYLKFYDTENFEVYCFCPILEIDNKDMNKKIETEYFLVGGYDSNKEQGLIKLYRVIYNDEIELIEIKFIQDIILECFEGFKKSISCIIQSSQLEILVTCYDGNVYLFSEPNLEKKRENEDKSNLES